MRLNLFIDEHSACMSCPAKPLHPQSLTNKESHTWGARMIAWPQRISNAGNLSRHPIRDFHDMEDATETSDSQQNRRPVLTACV